MLHPSPDIIAQLKKDLLPLQGYKPLLNNHITDIGLDVINYSFPNNIFPIGAIHEFICDKQEDATATSGFIAGVVNALLKNNGACVWIGPSQKIFPPALVAFGIQPEKIIYISFQKEKELLWVMEEALKCEGLSAVVGEIKELSFTTSRRLQLAIEQSKVTGFIIRYNSKNITTTACIARWKITHLPSQTENDMPGVGFPRWQVELLKVRNGKTGRWEIEWVNGSFKHIHPVATFIATQQQRKTG